MHPHPEARLGVVILAGGEATRLPRKLELDAGGIPLILRVFGNVREAGPVYISASGSFPPDIDMALDCPIIIDRWPRRGPLAALYTAFEHVHEPRVFVVGGDMPRVRAATAAELAQAWKPGTKAVVPVNREGRLEPLCALYDRAAFLGVADAVLRSCSGGVATAVEGLQTERVRLSDERVFANVNTIEEYQNFAS